VALGLTFVLLRGWWARDRFDFFSRIARIGIGERTRQRAEDKARWYETHRVQGERRFAHLGLGLLLLGMIVFLVRCSRLEA
jgi:hypothetical protein